MAYNRAIETRNGYKSINGLKFESGQLKIPGNSVK